MTIKTFLHKLNNRWIKLRLQPIRVYCLHHVCRTFDEESMIAGDYIESENFKRKILVMRHNGVNFISLKEAEDKMKRDFFRRKKFAVLTFDDGYSSLKEILPWLFDHNIPVVLFINGKYLDGQSFRENPLEKYLKKDELWGYDLKLIEIGNHGWEHVDCSVMTSEEFLKQMDMNIKILSQHPRYIPFWAYTWGLHTKGEDIILRKRGITPVLIDGATNYSDGTIIHRQLLINNGYESK